MTRHGNLAREAHRRIIGMMFEGELRPGDALREAALGARLGMSRTPVREAIKRIESEGLAAAQGRSIRVRRLPARDVEEIFFLRLQLEPALARAATHLAASRLDRLETRIRSLKKAGPDREDTQWEIDDALHDMLAEPSGNQTARAVLTTLRQRTCGFDHIQLPERFLQSCDEHLAIIAAVRAGQPDGLEAALKQHLENARDAILARLREWPRDLKDSDPKDSDPKDGGTVGNE
ncbi:GntR family transcriptional regulator [Rhodobacteraceae bacterium F11138]|nr:GntR family transcriptional regulator [Rhodobacteraceae bacterium F11138]